jgi:hypothetical protein
VSSQALGLASNSGKVAFAYGPYTELTGSAALVDRTNVPDLAEVAAPRICESGRLGQFRHFCVVHDTSCRSSSRPLGQCKERVCPEAQRAHGPSQGAKILLISFFRRKAGRICMMEIWSFHFWKLMCSNSSNKQRPHLHSVQNKHFALSCLSGGWRRQCHCSGRLGNSLSSPVAFSGP